MLAKFLTIHTHAKSLSFLLTTILLSPELLLLFYIAYVSATLGSNLQIFFVQLVLSLCVSVFDSLLVFIAKTPQRLDVVVLAGFPGKYVKGDVAQVHCNPVLVFDAFDLWDNVAGSSLEFVHFSNEVCHSDHVTMTDSVD